MAKCKHENVTGRSWSSAYPRWYSSYQSRKDDPIASAIVCNDCGTWLSLGHSDETDERVAVEVRAAELADAFATGSSEQPTEEEAAGWRDLGPEWRFLPMDFHLYEPRKFNEPEWLAGYLARCIAEHTEESNG